MPFRQKFPPYRDDLERPASLALGPFENSIAGNGPTLWDDFGAQETGEGVQAEPDCCGSAQGKV